jgi:TolA-binding protein
MVATRVAIFLLCTTTLLAQATPSGSMSEVAKKADAQPLNFNQRYDQALQLFNAAQYKPAVQAYRALLMAPDLRPSYADNCYFWMGESYYAQKLWLDASTCFFKVLEFPRPNKEEDARMKLALSWYNMGDRPRACAEASSLLHLFPDSHFTKRARSLQALACEVN